MALTFSSTSALSQEQRGLVHDVLIVLGASAIIAFCAPLSIRLPFSPVPLAMQPSIVLFLGALLGSKRGALAVMSYLAQGAIGLPVFAGGKAGILVLAGPTGGYLLGYIVGAFLTGFIMERAKSHTTSRIFSAMGLGNLAIYVFGMAWLSHFVGLKFAFILGVLPFIVGDVLKIVLLLKGMSFLTAKRSL